jgi:hypothetical protein
MSWGWEGGGKVTVLEVQGGRSHNQEQGALRHGKGVSVSACRRARCAHSTALTTLLRGRRASTYTYEYSTTYRVKRGTHGELLAVAFRAGLSLGKPDEVAQSRAVRVKLNSGWRHGWLRLRPRVVGVAVVFAGKRRAKYFSVAQMRSALAEGSIELSYNLRKRM